MPDVMMRLGSEMLVFEGAMGTMLHRAGLEPGQCPEFLNLVEPEIIQNVHHSYYLVGADCSTSNTFGGSRPKLAEYGLEDQLEEINRAGVRLAREGGAPHVLADIGPTGLVMEPVGTATFDELFDIYAEQARALAMEAPDAFCLETFTDIAELRCAVLACKSVSEIPVIACVTIGGQGRMDLSGTDPVTAAVILEAAGAAAIGINCGLGPDMVLRYAKQMVGATTLPVIAQPNAGIPVLDAQGRTLYSGTPAEFAAFAVEAWQSGLAAVGSCCGSSPSYTGAMADEVSHKWCVEVEGRGFSSTVLAGPRAIAEIGAGPFRIIGERINPTGKKDLKESLLEGSVGVARRFAVEQTEAGADLLDVNVGAAGVDAADMLPKVMTAATSVSDLPLVIDTTDIKALRESLRRYPGKALVNSVNGDPASMESVIPLAAQYGAALVVLALDDQGIPESPDGRMSIVRRVRSVANALGIPDRDLVVDALTMTAATDLGAPDTTLETTRLAHEMGLSTTLGVSNVSHGLPNRTRLNSAFVRAAAAVGLSSAIANPNEAAMVATVQLVNERRAEVGAGAAEPESPAALRAEFYQELAEANRVAALGMATSEATAAKPGEELTPTDKLRRAVLNGASDETPALVDALITAGTSPTEVIADVLTPAIQDLGDAYGRGEVFLPQMIVAAEAMKAGVTQAKTYLNAEEVAAQSRGRVAFATVKGDIHSIGKDICISMLESQGYEVENLGVDVTLDRVLEVASTVDAIALSALMTTTLPAMSATVASVREAHPAKPVLVGGAVVTEEWARSVGALYSSDAPGCVAAVSAALHR